MKGIVKVGLMGAASLFKPTLMKKGLDNQAAMRKELGEEAFAKVTGNLKGSDSYQGATLLVGPGNVLHYAHFASGPSDIVSNATILAWVDAAKAEMGDTP
mmetsp:Transcript_15895/g.49707  ORF Transcript_15895/g.49707 Transcript_15895/m.49707 type:complete len:100 (-) Transcript_15895:154-453(-)